MDIKDIKVGDEAEVTFSGRVEAIDSGDDVAGATSADIVSTVESTMAEYGFGTKLGLDLEFHDGVNIQATINALPTIVAYLNAHDIGASLTLPSFTEYK